MILMNFDMFEIFDTICMSLGPNIKIIRICNNGIKRLTSQLVVEMTLHKNIN